MNRIILLVLGGAVIAPSVAGAQSSAEIINRALSPLPGRLAEGATVVQWNDDFTWTTIKDGTSPWVCYDRSGDPNEAPFAAQCTTKANLPRVAQNRRFDAQGTTAEERAALVTEAQADGTRIDAEYGSMFVSLSGESLETATIHTTIAVPYATGQSTGLPESGSQGGAWVMAAGSSEAHIMVPGR